MRNFLQQLQALMGRTNRDVTFWLIFILFSAGEENSLSSKLKTHTPIPQELRWVLNFVFAVFKGGQGPRLVPFQLPARLFVPENQLYQLEHKPQIIPKLIPRLGGEKYTNLL